MKKLQERSQSRENAFKLSAQLQTFIEQCAVGIDFRKRWIVDEKELEALKIA